MSKQFIGRSSVEFLRPPYINMTACIAGSKEAKGPIGSHIEEVENDPLYGMNTWEEAESKFVENVIKKLIKKADMRPEDIRYLFGGDLLGQLIGSTFGVKELNIPIYGVYGACATFGEAIALGAMTVAGEFGDNVIAFASSHYASAQKQFRFPLEYANQRPLSATWTVTGAGAVLINNKKSKVKITGLTCGKIVDYGVKDSMNMGACMAPAAADLIINNFIDFGIADNYYDMIITGDLGDVGKTILLDMLGQKGIDISRCYTDCGLEIYDNERQDTHSGGSGCGCSAVTYCSYIHKMLENGMWKRVLFVPTGALLSTVSSNEGKSVPAIAHGVILENGE